MTPREEALIQEVAWLRKENEKLKELVNSGISVEPLLPLPTHEQFQVPPALRQ